MRKEVGEKGWMVAWLVEKRERDQKEKLTRGIMGKMKRLDDILSHTRTVAQAGWQLAKNRLDEQKKIWVFKND